MSSFVERAAVIEHLEITTDGSGNTGAGYYYQPIVIASAYKNDEIVQREVFGYGKDLSGYSLEDYTAVRNIMIAH